MAARGFNTKTPTIKRILKEASELSTHPSPDFTAAPLDANLFEWHFTLRGPPAPSPYAAGIYHGRIVLPATYPLKPPNFRFLTPTGRFEVNREICLSISGHHEETWQPAWGIRTALVAIRSFMDSEAKGQVGGLECDRGVRERMALDSGAWRCPSCAKSNAEILRENEEACTEEEEGREEAVPEELRLAYREDLGGEKEKEKAERGAGVDAASAPASSSSSSAQASRPPPPPPAPAPQPTRTIPAAPPLIQQQTQNPAAPQWLDTAIYGVVAALLFMVLKKFAS
ncbi:UBC-like protein [Karstenula rhodostoma CBS 690.94]|uniref:UBC-like protein n=1 Tax=Karstenula rhodostoma CBS 690.94 TaxID=1392251 RepID=A0A9P4PZT5_9PLEO|nr:UBC-like protein [Karstenula rhodostoma CBS 690.94]